MLKKFIAKHIVEIILAAVAMFGFVLGFAVGVSVRETPTPTVIECKHVTDEVEVEPEENTPVEVITPVEEEGKSFTVRATAYCACVKCCGKSDGITATGTKATAGRTIAVDPKVIPYGSEVIIDGHTYIAEDTGGAIKGNKIDIYFDSHEEAQEFGVQELTVLVKEKEK